MTSRVATSYWCLLAMTFFFFFKFFSRTYLVFGDLTGLRRTGPAFVGCPIVEACALSFLKVRPRLWAVGGRLRGDEPLSSRAKPGRAPTASVAFDVDSARLATREFLIFSTLSLFFFLPLHTVLFGRKSLCPVCT